MLTPSFEQKLTTYTDIYSQLKTAFKWKMGDPKTLMMIASMYVINEKPFDLRRFESLSDYIKEQVGAFNTLKSSYRYTTAAMLDVRFENSEEKFHRLLEVYEKMVAGKFSRGASTYIAAQVMLEQIENGRMEDIERVMQVYKGMSSNHFFLTSSTDYPLAVLLAEREGTVNDLMKQIEYFYKCLNQQGFAKGNDLQFLSHILSLGDENKADALIEQCTKVADAFRTQWKKPKGMHYPLTGLLALLKEGEKEVATVLKAADRLSDEKHFKWHKDMNILMAANFLLSEKMHDTTLLGAGIFAAIEAIMQAQQAAAIAAIAATTAASSSSAGS